LRVRLHRHLVSAVVETVAGIPHGSGPTLERVVEGVWRAHPKWGSRDRRFFAGQVYEMVKWRRWYGWLAGVGPDGPWRVGDYWKMWAVCWLAMGGDADGFGEFPELAGVTREEVEGRKALAAPAAVRASFPDWLYGLGEAELGTAWPGIVAALNGQASIFLRANTLRTDAQSLVEILRKEGLAVVAAGADALRLEQRAVLAGSAAFRAGLFEVQDAGSQRVVPMLRAEPGMLVVDACAGGGGKTLQLAAAMKNEGRIIAQDVRSEALGRLRDRAVRAGAGIIRTETVASDEVVRRRAGTADRLLLDVPCSGLGVLRRQPDARWRLTAEELDRLCLVQAGLLREASIMLKPGGLMVYATCSVLPRENERQVESFLREQGARWELEESRHFLPGGEGDGFYAARLRRLP
jgi:16S rRNA (cytosine967-C5)-methyltransferase